MAAIITTPFRVLNAENFKEDVTGSSVYLTIGKSDVWSNATSDLTDTTPFVPGDHIDDTSESFQQLLGMKRVTSSDISHVVPRYNYDDGQTYVAWDSNDSDIFDERFYVVTRSEFKVYKCIKAGPSVTSVQPVHTGVAPVTLGDGYTWKYMYTITTADSEKFLTNSYMPVKTLAVSPVLADTSVDFPQQSSQILSASNANAAGIERIEVTNAGTGYSSKPTVTISGDGTGATVAAAQITMAGSGSNQTIASIDITNKGTDYTIADIVISGGGGSGGSARAVISPPLGHGVDPVKELGAFYIALNAQLDSAEGGDLTVGNDFRQIGILKNPFKRADNSGQANGAATTIVATASTLKGLKYLQMDSSADVTTYNVDALLTGGTSTAKAYLAEIDVANKRLYYYQNRKTGFKSFDTSGEAINGTLPTGGNSSTVTSNSLQNSEFVEGSGQLVFLENRAPISRTASQIEDIKCIIEF
jgi:hypothetical protein